jgi:hypothetical protein
MTMLAIKSNVNLSLFIEIIHLLVLLAENTQEQNP